MDAPHNTRVTVCDVFLHHKLSLSYITKQTNIQYEKLYFFNNKFGRNLWVRSMA